jgi:hypothetical protein
MLSLCARSGGAGLPTSARVSPSSAIPVRSSAPILLVFRLQRLLGLSLLVIATAIGSDAGGISRLGRRGASR